MKRYRVEITEKENGYGYRGEWDNDFLPEGYVEAESIEEAEEIARDYLDDNGEYADDYIYRVREIA